MRFGVVKPCASRLLKSREPLSKLRGTRCTRFGVVKPCESLLLKSRAPLSKLRGTRCMRFGVVKPCASRLSKSREPLSKLRGTRCTRFGVVKPCASRLSVRGVRLSEELAPLSERVAPLCARFHVVEPLASRLSPKHGRRSACRDAPPRLRASPRPKRHVLAEVGEPRPCRLAHPHGMRERRTREHGGRDRDPRVPFACVLELVERAGPPGACVDVRRARERTLTDAEGGPARPTGVGFVARSRARGLRSVWIE
jgi:hypothetical protein